MKQQLNNKMEEWNNNMKFPLFPFTKPAGVEGKKGNNAFRLIPLFPRRFAEVEK